jgi:hypothetical protein
MELKANTTEQEFKIITKTEDEPDLKTAQDLGVTFLTSGPNGPRSTEYIYYINRGTTPNSN